MYSSATSRRLLDSDAKDAHPTNGKMNVFLSRLSRAARGIERGLLLNMVSLQLAL